MDFKRSRNPEERQVKRRHIHVLQNMEKEVVNPIGLNLVVNNSRSSSLTSEKTVNLPSDHFNETESEDITNNFREVVTPKQPLQKRALCLPGSKDIFLQSVAINNNSLIPYVVFTISIYCSDTRWNVKITQKQVLRLYCRLLFESIWHRHKFPVRLPWNLFMEKPAKKRSRDGSLVLCYLQRLLSVPWIRSSSHMQAFLEFSHTRISIIHGPSIKEGYAHMRLKGHANTASKRFGFRINEVADIVVNILLWIYFIAFFVFIFVPLATLLFVSAPLALITGNVNVIQFPSTLSSSAREVLNYCAFFLLWILLCLFLFYAFKFFESRMFREVRWVVLKPSCLAFYKSKESLDPSEVILFDDTLSVEKSTIRQGLLWMPNGLTVDTKMASVEMDIGHKYAVFLQAVCFIGSYLIIANNYIDDGDTHSVVLSDYKLDSRLNINISSGGSCGIYFILPRDGVGISFSENTREYSKIRLLSKASLPQLHAVEYWDGQSRYQPFQLNFDSFRFSFTNFLRNFYYPGAAGTAVAIVGEPKVAINAISAISGQSFSSRTMTLTVNGLVSVPNNGSYFEALPDALCAIPFAFSGAGFWPRVISMLGTCVIGALLALVSMHIITILFSYIGIWHANTRRDNWLIAFKVILEKSVWIQKNRYDAFAPNRKGKDDNKFSIRQTIDGNSEYYSKRNNYFALKSEIKFHVDGKDTFAAIYDAIENAKYQIMICGWWISPDLYLLRPASEFPHSRLDDLLLRKATQGIQVYVLLYRELSLVLTINSWYTKRKLRRHKNIHILRDPAFQIFDLGFWSHHEKIVCIDQRLAFVGGLDLCFGRYDTANHSLSDNDNPLIWPGKDYSNPRVKDFMNLENPLVDLVDRSSVPRMPWHDVHCSVSGLPAQDAARHFVQRWNYVLLSITYDLKTGWCRCCRQRRLKRVPKCILPVDSERWMDTMISNFSEEVDSLSDLEIIDRDLQMSERFLENSTGQEVVDDDLNDDTLSSPVTEDLQNQVYSVFKEERTAVDCQLLRSAAKWSCGVPTETSIQAAYIDCIRNANHFIYIENQFFVSGLDGNDLIKNRILQALVDRIALAVSQKKNFRVMIVMPLLPAFEGDVAHGNSLTNLHAVMHWQYQTLSRGKNCLFGALQSITENPEKYIGFFGLRTHEVREDGFIVTEQIYVHSKIMIVDDRVVVIGSANINDRSMNGSRDSEIAYIVSDVILISGFMNNELQEVGTTARDLRMQLFREHLSVDINDPEYQMLCDPCSDESWDYICQLARNNTAIYENIFYCAPSNSMRSYLDINGYKLMTVFENQRRKVTRAQRWAAENLTEGDPSPWTDVCGRKIAEGIVTEEEWIVVAPDENKDLPIDDEGWQYAPDFNVFGQFDVPMKKRTNVILPSLPSLPLHWRNNIKIRELQRLLAHSRRRKWMRRDCVHKPQSQCLKEMSKQDNTTNTASFSVRKEPSIKELNALESDTTQESPNLSTLVIQPSNEHTCQFHSDGSECLHCKLKGKNRCKLSDRLNIQGHLVEFPLDFLKDEVLRPHFLPKDLHV